VVFFVYFFFDDLFLGFEIEGLPVPTENNKSLKYRCNGVESWYLTLITVAVLHFSGIFPLNLIADNMGPLTMVAMITGNVISLLVYFLAILFGKTTRMSGYFVHVFLWEHG